jgi:hypothetical protein|nr:MAG TPA: hypothetical protein [Caudoviricetes sp.]
MGQNTGNSWTCQSGGDKHVLCTINTENAERCSGNGTDLRSNNGREHNNDSGVPETAGTHP